jgi:2'-5' RNA ligase
LRHRRLPRSFIAAVPDRAGRDALCDLQAQLRDCWPGLEAGWLLADDLHLTLRYLGDLYPAQLEAALAELQLGEAEPALCLQLCGVALWPALRPRLAVARFEDQPRLSTWMAALEQWAVRSGLSAEARSPVPHITLLRSVKPLPFPARLPAPAITLRLAAVQALHRSSSPRGARYQAHAEYRLI